MNASRVQSSEIRVVCLDLVHPSPLAEEIINARPYAFLDDAAAEERRTNAIRTRPSISHEEAASLRTLDPEATGVLAVGSPGDLQA